MRGTFLRIFWPVFTILFTFQSQVQAQQFGFVWGFNTLNTTSLPQCASLDIYVNTSQGTVKPSPPYYMIAYEDGGVPTWSLVGSQAGSLAWKVDHTAGKSLMLGMVDTNGNSGGILQQTYTVVNGSTASCLPTRSPTVTVSSNATSKLDTCGSVQLSIKNGQKPYTITVAETNTVSSANTTLGANDDTFIWVNNLSPGGLVVLAVSDSTETYGQATPFIKLTGDSNTRCSQQSRSFNSTATSKSGSSSKVGVIAGAVIAILILAILGLLAWFFLVRRRRQQSRPEKGWTIDRASNASPVESTHRGGFGPMPSEADLTPYHLPPSVESRSMRSAIGERMLNARDSTYSGTESGYHDPGNATPSPSQPSEDPFRNDGSQSSRSTPYYDQPPPLPPLQSSSQYGSVRSHGTGPSIGSFRTVNPDLHDTSQVWSRDSKRGYAAQRNSTESSSTRVFQHQDAEEAIEEIPPAYPGSKPSPLGGSNL